ncbi:MAG: hypothetical protein AB1679_17910 [Actinomycetota bacterium]
MPTALVTGAAERISDMVIALKSAGFDIIAAESDMARLPPGLAEVDCYVQLPFEALAANDDRRRAGSVVAQSMTARFDAAAHVAPMLTTNARVVLVGDAADGAPPPDLRLVRVLVEAVIADHGADNVRVSTIDGAPSSDAIVAAARLEPRSWTTYATIERRLGLADRRHRIMSPNGAASPSST